MKKDMNFSEKLDFIQQRAKKSAKSSSQLVQNIMQNIKDNVGKDEDSIGYDGIDCCCDDASSSASY